MSTRILSAAAVGLLACVVSAQATTISASYTAADTGTGPYLPTINTDGGPYLPSPLAGNLAVGQTTTPTVFLQVAPVAGNASVGTQSGSVAIGMTLSDGSAVTGVTTSAGGNGATVANGVLDFSANYQLFYGNQTDCLSWNSATCTPTDNTTTIGETLHVMFADNAVLAINLYNWSDWNMAPDISFELLSGPSVSVAEPTSFALLGSALIGLCVTRRRGKAQSLKLSA